MKMRADACAGPKCAHKAGFLMEMAHDKDLHVYGIQVDHQIMGLFHNPKPEVNSVQYLS